MRLRNAKYIKSILDSVKSKYSKDRMFQHSVDKARLLIDAEIIKLTTWNKSAYIEQLKKTKKTKK